MNLKHDYPIIIIFACIINFITHSIVVFKHITYIYIYKYGPCGVVIKYISNEISYAQESYLLCCGDDGKPILYT